MNVVSLFSGAGGMDIGFMGAGFNIVWANDIDSCAVQSYQKNLQDHIIAGDICAITEHNIDIIPYGDVIIGGFPCQDFSILGGSKRKGITVHRGQLYRSFVNLISHQKPKAFVAENVKGIFSANKGIAFQIMLKEFSAPSKVDFSGLDVTYSEDELISSVNPKADDESSHPNRTDNSEDEYRLFYNSGPVCFADYGVPQFRERMIIIGIRKDVFQENRTFTFPGKIYSSFAESHNPCISAGEVLEGEAIYSLDVQNIQDNNQIPKTQEKTKEMLRSIPQGGNFLDLPEHLKIKGLMSNIYRKLDRNKPSKTVIANGGGGTWGYHYDKPRALTNRERARLQTFPDDYHFVGNIQEVRRQIGNAVPSLGILPIASSLHAYLDSKLKGRDVRIKDYLAELRLKENRSKWTLEKILDDSFL